MSEFSESYHVRTEDPQRTKQLLREARLAGILFGPANGWLTFVPYEEQPGFQPGDAGDVFTKHLARRLGATVLHYTYDEDYGWSLGVADPDGNLGRFACWWYPEATLERENLPGDQLASLATAGDIEAYLRRFDAAAAAQELPAYKTAELLKLPAYKWISPHLAQHHADDLIAQGGVKLGRRPQTLSDRLQLPPQRKVLLPRPDLSAKEALSIIGPYARVLLSEWELTYIAAAGSLDKGGRLDVGVGAWSFSCRCLVVQLLSAGDGG